MCFCLLVCLFLYWAIYKLIDLHVYWRSLFCFLFTMRIIGNGIQTINNVQNVVFLFFGGFDFFFWDSFWDSVFWVLELKPCTMADHPAIKCLLCMNIYMVICFVVVFIIHVDIETRVLILKGTHLKGGWLIWILKLKYFQICF